MKIGVNARLLISDKMEGIARFIYETTVYMANAHPEDEFILFFDRKYKLSLPFPSNVKKVIVPWHARHSIIWYLWFEIMLPLFFKKYKIDVFYSGEGYLSKRSSVPTLMVLHDLTYMHYPEHIQKDSLLYFRKNTPIFLDIARSIVTVSHYVKNDIIQLFNVPEEKIKVAYNALSPNTSFEGSLETLDVPYFIYIGAIHPRKNVKNLIAAFLKFNTLHPQGAQLVLAGRMAWDTDEVEILIKNNKNIIYLGSVTDSEKNTWLKNAMCLVYVSLFEGFGIPLLEAMRLDVPVITSDVTSMPEVVADAALCVNPHDTDAIAEAMIKVYEDKGLRQSFILKGRNRVDFFKWEKSAQIIYDELKKIAQPLAN